MRRYSEKIIDGLERIQFFNQRAGRELWNYKPSDIQDQDIALTDKTLTEAIERIRSCEETIEQLEKDVINARHANSSKGKWYYQITDKWDNWIVDAVCPFCGFTKPGIWSGWFPGIPYDAARNTAQSYAQKIKLPNYCEKCGAHLQETTLTCGPDYCEIDETDGGSNV